MSERNWFSNSIVYHILIDRFAGFSSIDQWDTPQFLGGTLQGIIERLPYLQNLGVTTIWISPFNQTSAYHGYHITDFFQVDPHFGTLDDLKELIEATHEVGLSIICDFVPNHCSKEHPYFKEAQVDPKSPYGEWFYFTHWPHDYLCFLSIKELPKLNLQHKEAQRHIVDAAKYWLQFGFDGFRLDHVIGPSHSFWRHFGQEIHDCFPKAILIGEAWMRGITFNELRTINVNNKSWKWLWKATSDSLLMEYIDELDGVLDFRFQELIRRYIYTSKPSPTLLSDQLYRHYQRFPKTYYLPTFLDNHDMDRFLFFCRNDKELLKKAARFQFSIDQPAIMYYGTETGMTQSTSMWKMKSHGDLQARQPMNWKNPDTKLQSFYKKLIMQKRFG